MPKLPPWYKPLYEISLKNGQPIVMTTFMQWKTYESLFEGHPAPDLNRFIMKNAVSRVKDNLQCSFPHIIEADATPIKLDDPHAHGDEAYLPPVTCAARFTSRKPARDMKKDYSELAVIWYQDNPAMPIDEAVMIKIVELDWSHLASDCEW